MDTLIPLALALILSIIDYDVFAWVIWLALLASALTLDDLLPNQRL